MNYSQTKTLIYINCWKKKLIWSNHFSKNLCNIQVWLKNLNWILSHDTTIADSKNKEINFKASSILETNLTTLNNPSKTNRNKTINKN